MLSTRDKLADYAHRAWSGWMIYLLSVCTVNKDGSMTIPSWAVNRWERQMRTPYKELSTSEKISDLNEADKMMTIMAKGE